MWFHLIVLRCTHVFSIDLTKTPILLCLKPLLSNNTIRPNCDDTWIMSISRFTLYCISILIIVDIGFLNLPPNRLPLSLVDTVFDESKVAKSRPENSTKLFKSTIEWHRYEVSSQTNPDKRIHSKTKNRKLPNKWIVRVWCLDVDNIGPTHTLFNLSLWLHLRAVKNESNVYWFGSMYHNLPFRLRINSNTRISVSLYIVDWPNININSCTWCKTKNYPSPASCSV